MAKAKKVVRRKIRCYLCGHRFEVSLRTMSTTCSKCNRPIKVEDVRIKSYLPVNDLQTCGKITVTKRGRIAAKLIQAGQDIACEGSIEGKVEADGDVKLGAKATWKGEALQSKSLAVKEGATLLGKVKVPWDREEK